jgi:hypothetical protein
MAHEKQRHEMKNGQQLQHREQTAELVRSERMFGALLRERFVRLREFMLRDPIRCDSSVRDTLRDLRNLRDRMSWKAWPARNERACHTDFVVASEGP